MNELNQDNQIDDVISELRHNSAIGEVKKVNGNTIRFDIPSGKYGRIDLPKYAHWYTDSITQYTDVTRVTFTYVR